MLHLSSRSLFGAGVAFALLGAAAVSGGGVSLGEGAAGSLLGFFIVYLVARSEGRSFLFGFLFGVAVIGVTDFRILLGSWGSPIMWAVDKTEFAWGGVARSASSSRESSAKRDAWLRRMSGLNPQRHDAWKLAARVQECINAGMTDSVAATFPASADAIAAPSDCGALRALRADVDADWPQRYQDDDTGWRWRYTPVTDEGRAQDFRLEVTIDPDLDRELPTFMSDGTGIVRERPPDGAVRTIATPVPQLGLLRVCLERERRGTRPDPTTETDVRCGRRLGGRFRWHDSRPFGMLRVPLDATDSALTAGIVAMHLIEIEVDSATRAVTLHARPSNTDLDHTARFFSGVRRYLVLPSGAIHATRASRRATPNDDRVPACEARMLASC